jgi:hypothetical protein
MRKDDHFGLSLLDGFSSDSIVYIKNPYCKGIHIR